MDGGLGFGWRARSWMEGYELDGGLGVDGGLGIGWRARSWM